ncbi:MAG: hypothetical protein ACTHMS_07005 [Jatrophihabitans sp.]|uniref:hypothetical protein n=1 Tax=Jatrophihabitans sp. TaxID=1932789 RepID=UPI003F802CB0
MFDSVDPVSLFASGQDVADRDQRLRAALIDAMNHVFSASVRLSSAHLTARDADAEARLQECISRLDELLPQLRRIYS